MTARGAADFLTRARAFSQEKATRLAMPYAATMHALGGAQKLGFTDAGLALDDQQRTLTIAHARDQGRDVGGPGASDEDADLALRPKSLDEFIGQQAARENLRVFVHAAKARGEGRHPIYSRVDNPTAGEFERKLAAQQQQPAGNQHSREHERAFPQGIDKTCAARSVASEQEQQRHQREILEQQHAERRSPDRRGGTRDRQHQRG